MCLNVLCVGVNLLFVAYSNVFSSYLTDVQGSFTPEGDSTRNTRPIMCNRY
jgi:hypothetical protein